MGNTNTVHSYRQLLLIVLCTLAGTMLSYAQCPTVTNPLQTFCDVQAPTISNLVATNNGNGVRWYATATSTSALSNAQGLISGEDYYADDISGTCGTRQRVDVLIYGPPVGLSFQGVCVDSPNDATIADLIATGNNIQWYTSPNGGTALAPTAILMDNTIYYVNQSNPNTGCRTSRLSVFVNVGVVPVPLGAAIQEFCADVQPPPTVADLQASGSNNWYQTISSASPLDPTTPLVDGQSYFATTVDPPCESVERLEVVVVLSPPNDSGSSGSINLCETDLASTISVNLFNSLGGIPDTTGVWTGPLPTTNGTLGTVNVTTLTVAGSPYVFTYSVSTSPCNISNSTVTITIIPPPDAGLNGTLELCESDAPQDLINSLGGTPDPGGTWSPSMASGTGVFNPSVDAPGTYTYTVNGISPCGIDSAQVVVEVNPLPEPGTSGSINLCATDVGSTGSVNLFDALGGTPDTTGTWSGPLPTTNGSLGTVNVTTLTVAGSPYVFTYTVDSDTCDPSVSNVTITIIPPPDAGTDGALVFCENDAPQDLFNSLGGTPQPGGVWSPTLASGNGIFNPAVDTAGVYTYTVTGIVPCDPDTSQVTVTINPLPEPGSNGTITLCETEVGTTGSVNLFEALGGTPDTTGTWTGPLPTTNGSLGTVNVTTLTVAGSPYVFTYTVDSDTCDPVSSTVTITIVPPPDAGTNGTLIICESSNPMDLFNSLGGTPDAGGIWSPPLASGTGVFNPSIDAAGTYTYTVIGTPISCGTDTATVTVTINPLPNPGTNASILLCETDAPVDLFTILGGNPDVGGSWSPPLLSGTGVFDPSVDAPGTYTYLVLGTAPCGGAFATVSVSVNPQADAGINGNLNLCETDTNLYNLFDSLGGTPDAGGTWSPPLASGSGIYNPAVDAPGTYTYFVAAINSCGDDTATVTVVIDPVPNPGTNGSLAICENDTSLYNLFDSLSGADAGGIWSPTLASGTGIFDPTVDTAGTYTYTVGTASPCGSAASSVTVVFTLIPDAGIDGAITLCSIGTPVNLFDSLGGTPDVGGTWSPALTSGSGIFDPIVDVAGTYTYTLDGSTFCGTDVSTVTVAITAAPDASGLTLTVASICLNDPSEVTISGATQLADGQYSVTYSLSGANSSQTTVVLLIVNGSASFTIPASLLINAGATTFTLSGLTNTNSSCNANVGVVAPIDFAVFQDPTPQLITNGNSFCLEDLPTIADLTANLTDTFPVIWYDAFEDGIPYASTDMLVDGTTYYASSVIDDGCNNGIRLAVTVVIDTCAELELLIPDGFSPNDDTINDTFVIKNLRALYPDFNLQIYNRYGNILYEGTATTPDWNGRSDKGRELGNAILPVGVYFYILELKDSTNRTIQGRVYLSR